MPYGQQFPQMRQPQMVGGFPAPSPYSVAPRGQFLSGLRGQRRRSLRRHRRGLLGQLVSGTIDPSIQPQFFPVVTNTPGYKQGDLQNFLLAVNSRYIPQPFITAINGCSPSAQPLANVPGAGVATGTTSAGAAALKIAASTGPAAPFVAAAGAILEVIGSIFGAKARLEQTEDEVLCQQLNNFNQSLSVIDSGLEGGTLTSSGATQAYAYLIAQYNSAVQSAGIIGHDDPTNPSGGCDASCVFQRMINAILAQRNLDLQTNPPPADTASATGTTASITSAVSTPIAGVPLWAWLAGGAAAWLLFAN
jgi:hypothetical protein